MRAAKSLLFQIKNSSQNLTILQDLRVFSVEFIFVYIIHLSLPSLYTPTINKHRAVD